jgi:hypothetical protein
MTITELVQAIGDENISIQNLANNFTNGTCGKIEGKITFVTSRENTQAIMRQAAGIDSDLMALVLWFPKNKLPNP